MGESEKVERCDEGRGKGEWGKEGMGGGGGRGEGVSPWYWICVISRLAYASVGYYSPLVDVVRQFPRILFRLLQREEFYHLDKQIC